MGKIGIQKSAFWRLAVAGLLMMGNARAEEVIIKPLSEMPIHPGHSVSDVYTPVQHFKGYTFFVIPDVHDRPVVTQVDPNGVQTRVFLDDQEDYRALPDPHNGFSLGIDPQGYIHITGDMHQFGSGHSRNGRYPYPARYDDKQDAAMLYWRSVRPLDISAGFHFGGAKGASTVMPGTSWTYGRFINDRNGELYYSSRVRAFWTRDYRVPDSKRGSMAVGLYKYDTRTGTWTALGGTVPHKNPDNVSTFFNVLYWANSGRPDTQHSYQAYQANFNFDINNRLHFAGSGHIGDGSTVRLVYAYSDDEGRTWYKANGTRIPGLPLQGDEGAINLADVVNDSKQGSINKVSADRHGVPAIKVGQSGISGWYVWNGTQWVVEKRLPGNRMFQRPNGELLVTAAWGIWRLRDLNLDTLSFESLTKAGLHTPSQFGALSTGNLYGLVMNKETTMVTLREMLIP